MNKQGNPLSMLLRQWRDKRGRSQLDLSQRHISFIESDRSSPSRALLVGVAEVLNIPLRDCKDDDIVCGASAYPTS